MSINKSVRYLFFIPLLASLFSCASVMQRDREDLSKPIMQLSEDPIESSLEGKNFPRREGSVGGGAGTGGGCGC